MTALAEKQRWLTLASAAARLRLDAEIVRALCEPGGSLLMHGAQIGEHYYVLERGVERYQEAHP